MIIFRKSLILLVLLVVISNCVVLATANSTSFVGDGTVDDSNLNDNTNIDPDATAPVNGTFEGEPNSNDNDNDIVLMDDTNIDPNAASNTGDSIENVLKSIATNPSSDELYKKISQLYADKKDNGFKVFSNGAVIDFSKYNNVLPTIINGRTMVPLRAMAESIGAKVDWDAKTKLITISLNAKIVKLTLESKEATVDGVNQVLDSSATAINGRTMVPLRFIGEAFGKKVGWFPNGDVKIITIS